MTVAVLGKVWGRRGELLAYSLTSGPERFSGLDRVYLFGAGGAWQTPEPVEIESVWEHRGQLVFKFRGFDTISDAERFEGAEVRVPHADRAKLPPDEYYESDLIGCSVLDRANGDLLGEVAAFQEFGGPLLLQVSRAGSSEPLLIPFVRAICVEIDPAARRILVALPEGLKELNVR